MLCHLNEGLHNLGGTGALVVQLDLAPLCLQNSNYSLIHKASFTFETHFECLSLFLHPWPVCCFCLLLRCERFLTCWLFLRLDLLSWRRLTNLFSTSRKKALFWDLKMRFWLVSWSFDKQEHSGPDVCSWSSWPSGCHRGSLKSDLQSWSASGESLLEFNISDKAMQRGLRWDSWKRSA